MFHYKGIVCVMSHVTSHTLQENAFMYVYIHIIHYSLIVVCIMFNNKMMDMSALLGLLDKSHTWRHFATIYKALEQIKAIHSWVQLWFLLLLFDDRRSQNDNNDYYDGGDINIIVYTESFHVIESWNRFLSQIVCSFFLSYFLFSTHTQTFLEVRQ